MAVAAAVLSGCNMLLNWLVVLFPRMIVPLFLHTELESYSFGAILPFLLIKATLPVMLFIIALVNIKSDTFQEQRGIGTAVAIGVCWVLVTILDSWLGNFCMTMCVNYGSDKIALCNIVNMVHSFSGFLGMIARFLLISIASIEIYVTNKNLSETKQDYHNY